MTLNKAAKYGTTSALAFGAGNALVNVLNQNKSGKPFDWNIFLKAFAKGFLIGGATGFAFGYLLDSKMTTIFEKTEDLSGYLNKKLRTCTNDPSAILKKANNLRWQLYNNFGDYLTEYPTLQGSATKGTAIEGSDIDVQISFKRNIGTIENVYDIVNEFCAGDYADNAVKSIRSQKHSIGILYQIKDKVKRIDVVPLRELNNGSGDAYLYVRNDSFFGNPGYKKTNAKKQLSIFKFTAQQKRIIKLLKTWKIENNLSIKSIFIEYLVKKAFERNRMPTDISECLLEVVKFIGDNITTIRFVDPANTNNIISDSLTYLQKVNTQRYCYEMLDNVAYDQRNIIDYFTIEV